MNFAGVQSITIPEGDVRSIAIGGVTMWEKPNPLPYDAEVEYMTNVTTGTSAFVDTGYYPCDRTEIYIDTLATTSGISNLSCHYVSETNAFRLGAVEGYGLFWDFGSGAGGNNRIKINTPTKNWWQGLRLRISAGNRYLFDETTGYRISGTPVTFARKTRPLLAIVDPATRFYAARVWEASDLVRDFVPVRVGSGSSAVGYLYDRANPTGGPLGNGLYGSATSTPLVAGPDKNGG